ncbi:efflux RND transporter permease subunit [Leptospirillum ferriphilum]|uniref:Acriflavin resistance protein n=2 Tax=Leptospirillum ferriphilum TaxID=178606 RepID=A0A1V3SYB1_9BACT|nr:efflux RND transporter permease subunit [Leptospirillum ferriphilum]AFS53228.1 acriflavin resistance protein [Leptospirillum ferriphilum ML-04]OOH75170.1 acriflavin resistance protein [Leptospirillum ferriphilum]
MFLVRIAIKRPYTIFVMAAIILIMGIISFNRMILDIFPSIDIPVVNVVWNYPGLSALDMEERIVLIAERAYSTTVNGISRIESESINGTGLIKIYFHQNESLGAAIAQISAVSETLLRIAPPGTMPPNIIQYNASNVPVVQMEVQGHKYSEQQLFDYGLNFIRMGLFTIPGLSTPAPFGGKIRQVMVDVYPDKLAGYGLSPNDIVNTLIRSNIIVPGGTAKIGDLEMNVQINGSPSTLAGLGRLPVKAVNGTVVRLRDVARVHDGYAVQENIVRVNGHRSTYLAIYRHAGASTLKVVEAVRHAIPRIESILPPGIHLKLFFDQSVFVKNALLDVLQEGLIGTVLVGLMIFLFLGDFRSTLIILLSIPLSVLSAIFFLKYFHQTLNIMTLGGLALAIGMLVDDATVAIENIERNRALSPDPLRAVWDGANQVALPAFVGTSAILIVFFPVILLKGVSQFLFTPMALAVVFSMLASYFLSRTLVVTLSMLLHQGRPSPSLAGAPHPGEHGGEKDTLFQRFFEKIRTRYTNALKQALKKPKTVVGAAIGVFAVSGVLLMHVGVDFFPPVDAGLIALHMRAPNGSRIEVTDAYAQDVYRTLQNIIPPNELKSVDVNIGLPIYYNLAFYQTDSIGAMDADFLISLKSPHRSVFWYQKKIRDVLHEKYPAVSFWYKPADIISQVLDFGLPAPIDIQVQGRDLEASYRFAQEIRRRVQAIPGAVDVSIPQVMHYPTLFVRTRRADALKVGLTQNDVASNLLVATASSTLINPNYWVNPKNTINYIVAVQAPTESIASLEDLERLPITTSNPPPSSMLLAALGSQIPPPNTQLLSNIASIHGGTLPGSVTHYTIQRTIDVLVNIQDRDLGSLTAAIKKTVRSLALPPGTRILFRGQSQAMLESFRSFGIGLLLAILLVYLLLVMNFQSFLDPFIILVSIPAGLSGVAFALLATHTTLNVESAMGAIMVVGVATANSILLVTFANEERGRGASAVEAAIAAGSIRLRPILMTATAMILGMLPMAFGAGSGGEQNAPLGRAVIGGLLVGTISTLFLVPTFYILFRKKVPNRFRYDEAFNRSIGGDPEKASG